MNEAIKKADMHYVGFIDTCMQMGIEKDAADRLYKEAVPKVNGRLIKGLVAGGALSKAKPGVIRLGQGLAASGSLTGPGIAPVPKLRAVRPSVRPAPPRNFTEFEKRYFSYIPDPVGRRKFAWNEWERLHFPANAKTPATMTRTAPVAGGANGAPAANAGAAVTPNATRAAGAQLTANQRQLLNLVVNPAEKAQLEARFLKWNSLHNQTRAGALAEMSTRTAPVAGGANGAPAPVRQDLNKAVGAPERLLKLQTAKLRRSLRGGTAGAGNAAAGLESAADTVPAAGSYLPWLALGGGLGAGLVGYGLVSNRSAA